MKSNPLKHSPILLTFAGALLVLGCDPEELAPDESIEALEPAEDPGPDQVGLDDPGEAGFPAGNCQQGFRQAGPRLCIDQQVRQSRTYLRASADCKRSRSQVCSVEDLAYLYRETNFDGQYNPRQGNNGRWLGNYVGDGRALCGNRVINSNNDPDQDDFDGVCNAQDQRAYWCCHDDDRQGGGGGNDGGWDDDDDGWDDDDGGWDGN